MAHQYTNIDYKKLGCLLKMILLVYRQFFEKLTKRYSEVSKMWINNATAFAPHTTGIPFGVSKEL